MIIWYESKVIKKIGGIGIFELLFADSIQILEKMVNRKSIGTALIQLNR